MNHRAVYIQALHDLANWYTAHPQAPIPPGRILVPLATNNDVQEVAASLDKTVKYDEEGNTSFTVTFGPVICHFYGYADFAEYSAREDSRRALKWAEENGMSVQPNEPDADASANQRSLEQ